MDKAGLVLGKAVLAISRFFRLGAGGTWPGEVALKIDPQFIRKTIPAGSRVVLVAGTNGKTTTAKLVRTILEGEGRKVFHNQSGANLLNGVASVLVKTADWQGKVAAGDFVFEVDEAALPLVLEQISPAVVVLLNLFRDQLDRYGEVEAVARKWEMSIGASRRQGQTILIINGDDPRLAGIGKKRGKKLAVRYFGLGERRFFLSRRPAAMDSAFCPECGERLKYKGFYFSHLGKWRCGKCGFNHPKNGVTVRDVGELGGVGGLEGIYNYYNLLAAVAAAEALGVKQEAMAAGLASFRPAFGRQEEVNFRGKKVKILLSKNPAGFNEALRAVKESEQKGPLLLVLNDRVPDGRDVSWIYDVDFEELQNYPFPIFAAGDRAYDLGLRLKYGEVGGVGVCEGLKEGVLKAVGETGERETLWILPTYSAMLEVRKVLTGRGISED